MTPPYDPETATAEEKAAYHQGALDALADPPLTRDQIRKMSTQEVKERMSEVKEVLRRGVDPNENTGGEQ